MDISQEWLQEEKRDLNDVSDLTYCGNEWKFPTGCSIQVIHESYFLISYYYLQQKYFYPYL